MTRVGGLDGCRAGWLLATADVVDGRPVPGSATAAVVATFAEALVQVVDGRLDAIGVDMPIGLPAAGSRAADRAARRRLGPRRSSVFPTPVRPVLGATDYVDALARSRAVDGRGLSKQAFNLLPRIAEVDAAMTPDQQVRVFECHPETAFARLAGAPLATTKRQAAGRHHRGELLAAELGPIDRLLDPLPTGARVDDVLDALVVVVIAARSLVGDVERLGDATRDDRGLRMEIVV